SDSNAIEHESSVLLLLGEMRPEHPEVADSASLMDVSVVKSRFGRADQVVTLRAELASGRFAALDGDRGEAVGASDRRAARKAETADRVVVMLELAMEGFARKAGEPLFAKDLKRAVTGGGADAKQAAVERLIDSGRLVHVNGDGVKKRG